MPIIAIIKGDLFASTGALAHCVSQDFEMGKGIAVLFKRNFGAVNAVARVGDVVHVRHQETGRDIFHLVTKSKYFLKPTYDSLCACLKQLNTKCIELGIKKISIPKIGCGLDQLNWDHVAIMLDVELADVDVDVYEL